MTVHSLLGFTLRVPDVPAGKRFYEDFGLTGRDYSDRLAFRFAEGDAEPVNLTEGKGRRLHHIVFGVDTGQVKPLRRPGQMTKRRSTGRKRMPKPPATPPSPPTSWTTCTSLLPRRMVLP